MFSRERERKSGNPEQTGLPLYIARHLLLIYRTNY
jgi:hypothetical protein